MSRLKIFNPANGAQIAEVPADDAASVSAKAQQARAAQPVWARVPYADRRACIERFRAGLVADARVLGGFPWGDGRRGVELRSGRLREPDLGEHVPQLSLHHAARLLGELRELPEGGQVLQGSQPEELQEVRGRSVEQRSTWLVLLAEDADEVPLEEHLQHGAAVHAANVVDLRPRDGLPVCQDGEGLRRSAPGSGRHGASPPQ